MQGTKPAKLLWTLSPPQEKRPISNVQLCCLRALCLMLCAIMCSSCNFGLSSPLWTAAPGAGLESFAPVVGEWIQLPFLTSFLGAFDHKHRQSGEASITRYAKRNFLFQELLVCPQHSTSESPSLRIFHTEVVGSSATGCHWGKGA